MVESAVVELALSFFIFASRPLHRGQVNSCLNFGKSFFPLRGTFPHFSAVFCGLTVIAFLAACPAAIDVNRAAKSVTFTDSGAFGAFIRVATVLSCHSICAMPNMVTGCILAF